MQAPVAAFVGFLAVIGLTIYLNANPPPTRNGKVIVPQKSVYHLIRTKDEVDGSIQVQHVPSGDTFSADLYAGNLYQLPAQAESNIWSAHVSHDRYFVDPGLDVGTYGSLVHGDLDVGVKLSPARFAFGACSPDLLISDQRIGVGISVYPPREHFGSFWSHVGIGISSMWDYRDGDRSTAVYLTFTSRN